MNKSYNSGLAVILNVLKTITLDVDYPSVYTADIIRNMTTVQDFTTDILEHKHVAIRGTYSIRKTHFGIRPLIEYCKSNNLSVCFVSEKVSLAVKFVHDFDFTNYKDITGKIECEYISIQFDSIQRLARVYDVLILDEVKGLLSATPNPTMRNINHNVKRFYNLLENCTYSIICDADLDDYTISLFKNTFNKDYKTIDYAYKKLNNYHAYINTNYFKFIENIKTDLLNNRKLYFPAQGKKKL